MNNVLIIHGGGLVDASKRVLLRIASGLWKEGVYKHIFLGRYSFMSLYDRTLWLDYDLSTEEELEKTRGTYFGTCRDINLTDPKLFEQSIKLLREFNINTIIVCGGDGSSRQCAEIKDAFLKHGINIIFAVPLTVDGINGGMAIGLDQATREAVRQIENVAATSLETCDKGKFSVVFIELQGRNRDDIVASVVQHFWRTGFIADNLLEEYCLAVVPANYETDEEYLVNIINTTEERTLVLISEGAKIKMDDLKKKITRKVRSHVVGHAVQSNGMTTDADMEKYEEWLADVVKLISEDPYSSYCIVNDGISRWREPIDYFAKLNPREGQVAKLSKGLEDLMKTYMA